MTSCWYVKDFADGWIKFYDVQCALNEAEETGAIMVHSTTGDPPSIINTNSLLLKQAVYDYFGDLVTGIPVATQEEICKFIDYLYKNGILK